MPTAVEELQKTALLSALLVKKADLEKKLEEIKSELEILEKEYGNFQEFEKKLGSSFQEHDIWIKWSFLREAKKRLEEELRAIEAELSSFGYK